MRPPEEELEKEGYQETSGWSQNAPKRGGHNRKGWILSTSATAKEVVRETLRVQMAFGSLVRCNHGLELFHALVFSLKKPRRKIRELGA